MDIELKNTMTATGQVVVAGPIDQRALCYGLLEIARDLIYERSHTQQRLVQPVGAFVAPPGS